MCEPNCRRALTRVAFCMLMVLALGATTQPTSIVGATKAVDDARTKLIAVEVAHREKLESSKEYKDAVEKLAEAKDAMEKARDSDDYKLRTNTLNAFVRARNALKELSNKSEADDAELQAAHKGMQEAEDAFNGLKGEKKAEENHRIEVAREAAEARKIKKIGDITVRLGMALRAQVPLVDRATGRRRLSDDQQLMVLIGVVNGSPSHKYTYKSWQADDFDVDHQRPAVLTDDLGNVYRRVNWGFLDLPTGRTEDASIYPLKGIVDMLVFEVPVAKAQTLHLILPGANVGAAGDFKFDFDVDEIKTHEPGQSTSGN